MAREINFREQHAMQNDRDNFPEDYTRGQRAPPWAVRLEDKLSLLLRRSVRIMARLDDLQAAVAANTDAEDAVLVLLRDIVQRLKDASGDPAKIEQLISDMEASTTKLAAAVVENTPTT